MNDDTYWNSVNLGQGRTKLFSGYKMNRRHVFIGIVASGLTGLVAPSVRADVYKKVICSKRLGPKSTILQFTQHELQDCEALLLQPSGNALWINSLRWQDERAAWHSMDIRRNIAPDRDFPLHFRRGTRQLELSVTTLPFQKSSTDVTLLGYKERL
jgi:hypothetical protein